MRQTKEVKIGDKDYRISEVPPIEAQEVKLLEIAEHRYRISKMNVFDAREIAMTYPMSLTPKLGDYKKNEELFRLLMRYVEVNVGNQWVKLENDELIRQHVPPMASFELEKEVIDLTTGFFSSGKLQDFTVNLVQFLLQNLIAMLMESLEPSLPKGKQP